MVPVFAKRDFVENGPGMCSLRICLMLSSGRSLWFVNGTKKKYFQTDRILIHFSATFLVHIRCRLIAHTNHAPWPVCPLTSIDALHLGFGKWHGIWYVTAVKKKPKNQNSFERTRIWANICIIYSSWSSIRPRSAVILFFLFLLVSPPFE